MILLCIEIYWTDEFCAGRKHVDEAVGSNVKYRLGTRPDQARQTDCGITTGGGDQCFAGRLGYCSYRPWKDVNPSFPFFSFLF